MEKRIKIQHIQIEVPYDVCNHYVYVKCTNKPNFFKSYPFFLFFGVFLRQGLTM